MRQSSKTNASARRGITSGRTKKLSIITDSQCFYDAFKPYNTQIQVKSVKQSTQEFLQKLKEYDALGKLIEFR